MRLKRGEYGAAPECKAEGGKVGGGETPEKAHQPAVLSGTIPTCGNPGLTPPVIEPSSPWREYQLDHTVFDTSWRTLVQSPPCTVTADNQCTVDISVFVHETAESTLQVIQLAYFP
ncbi:hypothetical protein PR048_033438, partial [Dryococelus australis]